MRAPREAYMDVWRITVAALRRWYILLPLLALTGYATLMVGDGVRPQYEVTATAILVPGAVQSEIVNPYGSMDETNTAIAIVLGNAQSRERIAELGLSTDYEVAPRSRSAIMDFSVISDTPEIGVQTGQAVFELAQQELVESQSAVDIPSRAQIGVQVLQAPSVSDVVTEGKVRNMAIVGIIGAALSLLIAVLFDDIIGLMRRWVRSRRQRRISHQDAERGEAAEDRSEADLDDRSDRARDEQPLGDEMSANGEDGTSPHGPRDRSPRNLAEAGRDG